LFATGFIHSGETKIFKTEKNARKEILTVGIFEICTTTVIIGEGYILICSPSFLRGAILNFSGRLILLAQGDGVWGSLRSSPSSAQRYTLAGWFVCTATTP